MKISDSLSSEALSRLAVATIKTGDIYRMNMTEADGVKPKPGDDSRNKYFIVLGFDADGTVYGGVIINSEINENIPERLKKYHLVIEKSHYKFLRYDSYIDCVRLKTAFAGKFNEWHYLGQMEASDLARIVATIKQSPAESKARLSRFSIPSAK